MLTCLVLVWYIVVDVASTDIHIIFTFIALMIIARAHSVQCPLSVLEVDALR